MFVSPDSPDTVITLDNFDSHMDHIAAQPSASNIPVQRLVQSVRQVMINIMTELFLLSLS